MLYQAEINNLSQGKYDLVIPVDHQFYSLQQIPNRAGREKGTLRNSFIEYEYSLNKLISVVAPEQNVAIKIPES